MTVIETATRVSLELGCCPGDEWGELYLQLANGNYDRCSVMPIPESLDAWRAERRTARKRADRCERRGYTFRPLAREVHADEIHEINTSTPVRQGRPMSAGYQTKPTGAALPAYPCARHSIRTYGVFAPDGVLVAYITLYRAGDLVLVSQILGHDAHLENEVMYLLFQGALEQEIGEPGVVLYNRHDSGTPGLVWFKERMGFEEAEVEWLP